MTKKKTSSKKIYKKSKKIGLLFNKVFEDFKKKQRINEKKEIKFKEEQIKKDLIKVNPKR